MGRWKPNIRPLSAKLEVLTVRQPSGQTEHRLIALIPKNLAESEPLGESLGHNYRTDIEPPPEARSPSSV